MKTIWKFPIPIHDVVTLRMPKGAEVLRVAAQGDQPCMWALVDTEAPKENRHFRFAGTGHPIDEKGRMKFIDTFFMRDGALVFHIFEYTRADAPHPSAS